MRFFPSQPRSALLAAALALMTPALACAATPLLVIDAGTGEVLVDREATREWYPASLTKLVTIYTALKAVRDGRITLDTPMRVSARAARMPPSKMGFRPGELVTLDNALKMMMVKSANDLAITVAEGVSGSVESFADDMNAAAAQIGMRESHFVNPNGLQAPGHYSSARDMAIVALALYRDFPEHADLYGIGAFRLGAQITPTHNGLMGRYPGAEGMKTGFTCPAGFNVVASATRNGRRLIAVVLGYPNAKARTLEAASLLDTGFGIARSGQNVGALGAMAGGPPDMRPQICGGHKEQVAEEDFPVHVAGVAATPGQPEQDSPAAFFRAESLATPAAAAALNIGGVAAMQAAMAQRPVFEPIDVYLGPPPGWTGRIAGPAVDEPAPAAEAPVRTARRHPAPKRDAHVTKPIKAAAAKVDKPAAVAAKKPAAKAAAGKTSGAKPKAEPRKAEARATPKGKKSQTE